MVTREAERRPYATWALSRIHERAMRGSVRYGGTRVQLDVDNLGLNVDDVCECLATLEESCFQHSERYAADGPWNDVYRRLWAPAGRAPDDLYIKLRLDRGCLTITLCSFHQSR
ncbi:MAG: type II toxin-antitoxin system MqsR family toxin [Rhodanobacteraceae bacterium]|nr:MAG: type II toxin-antitoxin system MqsR family toxin [Rhodanobacteraceae bacterium]